MKLSRSVVYALRALVQLAEANPHTPVSCGTLAAAGSMPERFLLQLLRKLVAHQILQSTRGAEGGYRLRRSADEITLLEVVEAIEGPLANKGDFAVDILGRRASSQLLNVLDRIAKVARAELEAVTLAQLVPQAAHLQATPESGGAVSRRS